MYHYPHHITDFNNATRHLDRTERSIYRDLIELYYHTEKPLNADVNELCRKVMARSEQEVTAVEQVLGEFFTLCDAGYVNIRCQLTVDDYQKNLKAKSKAGVASAKSRKLRKYLDNQASTHVEQPLNTRATPVDNHNHNHKPETITINQSKRLTESVDPGEVDEKRVKNKAKDNPGLEARREIWASYSKGYFLRYSHDPTSNAKNRSLIMQLQKRIGGDAKHVAEFYTTINDQFLIKKCHPVGLLVQDCEAYQTQWKLGRAVTTTQARQMEQSQSNHDVAEEANRQRRAENAKRS